MLPNGLIELRALMSAADAASAWDLRCDVRERLVAYLREKYPEALPRVRAEIGSQDGYAARYPASAFRRRDMGGLTADGGPA